MKNNSTMKGREYLFGLFWMGFVAMIGFRKLLFRHLPGMTYAQSKGASLGITDAVKLFSLQLLSHQFQHHNVDMPKKMRV